MLDFILITAIKLILALRYRVRVTGLQDILQKGKDGILFLPNHPALIDPIILVSRLYGPFRTRALADENQIDRFLIRRLARRIGVLPIPDVAQGGATTPDQVRAAIDQCLQILQRGENLILYPAGRVYRQRLENIGGNSAVERILSSQPNTRVVLVRTTGLWGSSFSWSSGRRPSVADALRRGVKALLLSGIFFGPRRRITIELVEPADFPRAADRRDINRYLETFYNENAPHNTYVPYTHWESGGVRTIDEPARSAIAADLDQVPAGTRRLVRGYLEELTGRTDFDDDAQLTRDLGMDSLAQIDLLLYLQGEFGFGHVDVDAIQTVGDVMIAAAGHGVSAAAEKVPPAPAKWFNARPHPHRPANLTGMTICEAFLNQARRSPDKVAVADQNSGVKTYRDLITAILILQPQIEALPGQYVGIMMPASLAVSILYLAVLFAGKTPVMINWTQGRKNLQHSVDALDIKHILTAKQLVTRLQGQGIDLACLEDRFLYLEDIIAALPLHRKLAAALRARLSWRQLHRHSPANTDPAVVLFTSGSESVPKAVPLTHKNILTNVHDAYDCFTLRDNDSVLAILPPFHSFGLTVSVLLPLCLGARAVCYPNPTHGAFLAQIIDAYDVSILIGTPTFLDGIVRAAEREQLSSLRLVVSGAEKCPDRLYQSLAQICPQTVVLEGYGVTECSPVISVNHEDAHAPGTIGYVMGSLDHVIVDVDSGQRVARGSQGMLLVAGASIFDGYLNYDGPSPFVEFEGRSWYRTGDLVIEDDQGVLTFAGRLKRFIKLGGEMISLPAIEAVLDDAFRQDTDDGPILAVIAAGPDEQPEVTLVTTKDISRQDANRAIQAAGMSGLHNIRTVRPIDELPLLGTGKLDYKQLSHP